MADRVYIETTVVSYLTARPSRDLIIAAHQQITHDWWDARRTHYELCVSELVLDESGAGDAQAAQERLLVVRHLANGTMRPVIEAVCIAKGLKAPIICTPEELLEPKP